MSVRSPPRTSLPQSEIDRIAEFHYASVLAGDEEFTAEGSRKWPRQPVSKKPPESMRTADHKVAPVGILNFPRMQMKPSMFASSITSASATAARCRSASGEGGYKRSRTCEHAIKSLTIRLKLENPGLSGRARNWSMPETWYRGAGAGVPPSTPGGGDLHDLGEGLYLTDTEDVAWQYAKLRAPGYKEYQVWQVTIERQTLGHVLDLTMDPRWAKFMSEPVFPGIRIASVPGIQQERIANVKQSRLSFLRGQYELYGKFFEEFLRVKNINIESYEAVIGPEYLRGGKQLCILHKNRLPTAVTKRIRSLFTPEPWAARLAEVARIRGLGRAAGVAGAVGKAFVFAGLGVAIGYLSQWIADRYYNKDFVREGLDKLGPEIEKYVAARTRLILDFYLSYGRAYVTGTVQVKYRQSFNPLHPHGAADSAAFAESVLLDSLGFGSPVGVTLKILEGSTTGRTEGEFLDIVHILEQSFSSEVTPPKQRVDEYRDAMQQMKWYEDRLKDPDPNLRSTDVEQLKKDREALWDWIDLSFGRLDDFQANRALWTKDGYARITGEK
jgi:hypothetical protein